MGMPTDRDRKDDRAAADSVSAEPGITRRRLGGVVHDQVGRGTAVWIELDPRKPGQERVPLSIADDGPSTVTTGIRRAAGFDPYGRVGVAAATVEPETPKRKPKDLRKLGEWLKLRQAMEQRGKDRDPADDT